METKSIATPNFLELIFEVDKLVADGWRVLQDPYPFFNYFLYEVHLSRETVVGEKQQEATPVRKGRPAKENKE